MRPAAQGFGPGVVQAVVGRAVQRQSGHVRDVDTAQDVIGRDARGGQLTQTPAHDARGILVAGHHHGPGPHVEQAREPQAHAVDPAAKSPP